MESLICVITSEHHCDPVVSIQNPEDFGSYQTFYIFRQDVARASRTYSVRSVFGVRSVKFYRTDTFLTRSPALCDFVVLVISELCIATVMCYDTFIIGSTIIKV